MLELIKNDPWLEPYKQIIESRYNKIRLKEKEITKNNTISLSDFANGHIYFGLNKTSNGWVIREWAPNATEIFLIGSFNDWKHEEKYKLSPIAGGVWELHLNPNDIHHLDYYKLHVKWPGGSGERIPAWCRHAVQDEKTHLFSGQIWEPENKYVYKNKDFIPSTSPILIYECHIGMASEEESVGTYNEFRENILPKVKEKGYNTIQLMAIQEHPYYGSFGYHVSSFFAPSSRFGTPDELRLLIDEAHGMGIAVIMDIVHSHAVKNEAEGLGRLDGSYDLYFHGDDRRVHKAWDSLCFNYGKDEVMHFLLSNCKYWLEEFKFDGYRFDGVTSMLYYSHGLEESFVGYENYYNKKQDFDAICYLTLANKLIHEVNPNAITVAEEVSGMPGLAIEPEKGGYGFDYRMAMNIPDFWIKTIKEVKDEDWDPSAIFWEVTNRRAEEKTVSYVESHDQALVGDKTLIFRLIDKEMYWFMSKLTPSMIVDRGIALHKMIRLVTASTINGGYLTFMGNEFGHPEWVDFPREGNDWSYKYARRQWSLNEDSNLKYHYMGDFDKEMISLIKSTEDFQELPIIKIWEKKEDNVLAYLRGDLLFIYNFNPTESFTDYGMLVPEGEYKVILNTDEKRFGGFGLTDDEIHHFSHYDELYNKHNKGWLKVYIPAHTAVVLKKIDKLNKLITMNLYPLKFKPILKNIIWGGDEIAKFKNLEKKETGVGESWEISAVEDNVSVIENGELANTPLDVLIGEAKETLVGKKNFEKFGTKFPLLIKFIDARDDLSIQVHPDDKMANERHNSFGKTEMWYIVKAAQGASIYSGFKDKITPEQYVKKIADNTFTDALEKHYVQDGDVYFMPAGRVHAIGSGCFVAEIQQTSNITYRIYDYNRKDKEGNTRELHTELAKDAIDYTVHDSYKTDYKSTPNETNELVSCEYFTTNLLELDKPLEKDISNIDSFIVYMCLEGTYELKDNNQNKITVSRGETILVPAATENIVITPTSKTKLLETFVK